MRNASPFLNCWFLYNLAVRKPTAIYLKAEQIDAAVRALFAKNGYVVLSQVRNGTGFEKRPRTADMLAISTWPSRGLFAEGIEIKISSGDLRHELSNPKKAEDIAQHCRLWYLAVPQGMNLGMLPPAWGVITVDEKLKAKVTKPAAPLKPKPMDEVFVCSVLRNFSENYVPLKDVEGKIREACDADRKRAKDYSQHRQKELEDGYRRFKEITGIDLLESHGHPIWDMKGCGDAIKLLMGMRNQPLSEIFKAKEHLESGIKAIEAALAVLDNSPKLEE
jgi:hypothetical protein